MLAGVDNVVPDESLEELYLGLVKGCVLAGEHELAQRYYDEMVEKKVERSSDETFEQLAASTEQGVMGVQEWWFALCLRSNFHGELSKVAMTIVANSAVRRETGMYPTAAQYFRWTDESDIEPTVLTFAFLVDAAVKKQDLIAAERLYERSIEAGLTPDMLLIDEAIPQKADDEKD